MDLGPCSFSLLSLTTFGLKSSTISAMRILPKTSSLGNRWVCHCVWMCTHAHTSQCVCGWVSLFEWGEPSTEVSTSGCVALDCVLQLWYSKLPYPTTQGAGAVHRPRERHWDDVIPFVIVWVVTVVQVIYRVMCVCVCVCVCVCACACACVRVCTCVSMCLCQFGFTICSSTTSGKHFSKLSPPLPSSPLPDGRTGICTYSCHCKV